MSAERFFNAIPKDYHQVDSVLVTYFVYYLVEELGKPAATASEIKQCFVECDITPPGRIAQYLSEGLSRRPPHYVKASGTGYRLDRSRKEAIAKSLGARDAAVQTSAELRNLEKLFPDGATKDYLDEAIVCFEAGANRAAVIMVWVLTMHHFITHIFEKKLAEFNIALAAQPVGKLTKIVNRGDFADIKEGRIIELSRNAKIITGDVQKILKDGLDARNTAAHPSDVKIARSKAISVIEDLVTNVIKKF